MSYILPVREEASFAIISKIIPPAPTVYCKKDEKKVPVWYCLGSFTQGRATCQYLIEATIRGGKSAEVECVWRKDDR